MTAPLICVVCGKRIKRGSGPGTEAYDDRIYEPGGIERAWHRSCERELNAGFPVAPEPTPFQSLVLAAKQVIAQSRNLSPVEQQAFVQIVGRALTEQRPDTSR